jgi:hypothetical protein
VLTGDVQTVIRLGERLSDGRRSPGDSSERRLTRSWSVAVGGISSGDRRCETPVSCQFGG